MATEFYTSIDSILGESRGRFFGYGYTQCRQSLHDFAVEEVDGSRGFRWRGSVEVPDNWSSKGGVQQSPHLSTIDVIELTLQCAHALNSDEIDDKGRRIGAIRAMSITAGSSPVEGGLSSIPIVGKLDETRANSGVLHLTIANMHVAADFLWDNDPAARCPDFGKQVLSVDEVLVHSDEASPDALVASALLEALGPKSDQQWSAASCFAATLQLGQALLYRLDRIERARSNTLWMKRTSVISSSVQPEFEGRQPIHVKLKNAKRYEKADGFWRRADIHGFLANMQILCSVTHRLPS